MINPEPSSYLMIHARRFRMELIDIGTDIEKLLIRVVGPGEVFSQRAGSCHLHWGV